MKHPKHYYNQIALESSSWLLAAAVVAIGAIIALLATRPPQHQSVGIQIDKGGSEHRHRDGAWWCGAKSPDLHDHLKFMETARSRGHQKQRRHLRSGPYTVNVRFIDIKASDVDADVPQAEIDASVATMNEYFSSSDFTFNWMETAQVTNSALATCSISDRGKHASIGAEYREGDETTLNVFLCDVPDEGVGGIAYYPYEVPIDLIIDGIYTDPRFLGQGKFLISHEAGHWLGLQHPFENGCAFPGDFINDTPYQTELVDEDVDDCNNPPNTCPEREENGPASYRSQYTNSGK